TTSVYYFNQNEIHFTVFNTKIEGGEIKLNVHNDARWVTIEELGRYEFMPADIVFVERLVREQG
ncbi:MAG TPA: 8-oxo-dGTP diphosphatase MutT, partial [Clostridia bacterium]